MAGAADEQPLLCVIDDAQWLDQVSVQTLAFVARRLMAEPVALVFAVRDGGAEALAGLPELGIRGLSDSDARDLLESVVVGGSIRGCETASWQRRAAFRWPWSRSHETSPRQSARAGSGTRLSARRPDRSKKASCAAFSRCRSRPRGCCSSRRPSRWVTPHYFYEQRRSWAFRSTHWGLPKPRAGSSSARACGFTTR